MSTAIIQNTYINFDFLWYRHEIVFKNRILAHLRQNFSLPFSVIGKINKLLIKILILRESQ